MIRHLCDRCYRVATVKPFEGRDLCAPCRVEFVAWVDAGRDLAPVQKPGRPHPARLQARQVCMVHGYVNSALFAELRGTNRSKANWALHALARAGHLVFVGDGRFELPQERRSA